MRKKRTDRELYIEALDSKPYKELLRSQKPIFDFSDGDHRYQVFMNGEIRGASQPFVHLNGSVFLSTSIIDNHIKIARQKERSFWSKFWDLLKNKWAEQ
jgi:hypothetical protein